MILELKSDIGRCIASSINTAFPAPKNTETAWPSSLHETISRIRLAETALQWLHIRELFDPFALVRAKIGRDTRRGSIEDPAPYKFSVMYLLRYA